MEVNSAFNAGVSGFMKAEEQVNQSARNIADISLQASNNPVASAPETQVVEPAQPSAETVITQEMVEMKVAEYQAKASAKVIQTADDMMGTLVDVEA